MDQPAKIPPPFSERRMESGCVVDERKTLIRIKRKQDQDPLEALFVEQAARKRRRDLSECVASVSLAHREEPETADKPRCEVFTLIASLSEHSSVEFESGSRLQDEIERRRREPRADRLVRGQGKLQQPGPAAKLKARRKQEAMRAHSSRQHAVSARRSGSSGAPSSGDRGSLGQAFDVVDITLDVIDEANKPERMQEIQMNYMPMVREYCAQIGEAAPAEDQSQNEWVYDYYHADDRWEYDAVLQQEQGSISTVLIESFDEDLLDDECDGDDSDADAHEVDYPDEDDDDLTGNGSSDDDFYRPTDRMHAASYAFDQDDLSADESD